MINSIIQKYSFSTAFSEQPPAEQSTGQVQLSVTTRKPHNIEKGLSLLVQQKSSQKTIKKITRLANQLITKDKVQIVGRNQRLLAQKDTNNIHNVYLIQETVGAGAQKTASKVLSLTSGEQAVFAEVLPSPRLAIPGNRAIYQESLQQEYLFSQKYKNHPHMLQIHSVIDYTADGGALGYVAEYCDQGTLSDEAKIGPLTADRFAIVITQLLQTLELLHSNNDVHNDIKPANIFLKGPEKTIKFADFGSSQNAALAINRCGTFMYRDPIFEERLVLNRTNGSPIYSETAFDIFSTGMLIFLLRHGCRLDKYYGLEQETSAAQAAYQKNDTGPHLRLIHKLVALLQTSTDPVDKVIIEMIDPDMYFLRPTAGELIDTFTQQIFTQQVPAPQPPVQQSPVQQLLMQQGTE